MKIFLTGATGFPGHPVARELTSHGAQLRLLVRKSSNLANLQGIQGGNQAETHIGDLSDPASLSPALVGCDALMHVAADYRLWIPDPAAMHHPDRLARRHPHRSAARGTGSPHLPSSRRPQANAGCR